MLFLRITNLKSVDVLILSFTPYHCKIGEMYIFLTISKKQYYINWGQGMNRLKYMDWFTYFGSIFAGVILAEALRDLNIDIYKYTMDTSHYNIVYYSFNSPGYIIA